MTDGSIEAVRSIEQYSAHADKRKAKVLDEIAQAKEGLRAVLSREAAAEYLGMSTKTLFRMIQRGEGPPYQKNAGTSRSANERVYFPFDELKAWHGSRTQYTSPADREQLAEEAKRNELRRRVAELEAESAALRKALRRSGDGRILAFDGLGLAALVDPHPWVFDGDRVVGHALTVDDEALEQGEILVMSMEDALLEDWADVEGHEHFTEVYVQVLEQASRLASSWHKRMALQELARR